VKFHLYLDIVILAPVGASRKPPWKNTDAFALTTGACGFAVVFMAITGTDTIGAMVELTDGVIRIVFILLFVDDTAVSPSVSCAVTRYVPGYS
jgi:uncharacterized membrane protein YdcZ (DUF606 family)